MVYSDLNQNPLIVPLEILRGHTSSNGRGETLAVYDIFMLINLRSNFFLKFRPTLKIKESKCFNCQVSLG